MSKDQVSNSTEKGKEFEKKQTKVKDTIKVTYNVTTIKNSLMRDIVEKAISYNYSGDVLHRTFVNGKKKFYSVNEFENLNFDEQENLHRIVPFKVTKRALLFIGNSGCAKTAVIEQMAGTKMRLPAKLVSEEEYAEMSKSAQKEVQAFKWNRKEYYATYQEYNIKVRSIYMSHMAFQDRQGLPELKEKYFEYIPPKAVYNMVADAKENPNTIMILFFDELMASEYNLNFIMSTIQEKRWGDLILPDNVFMVAATNPWFIGNYQTIDPGDALMKRFATYFIVADINETIKYYLTKGMHNLIIEYLKNNPDQIEDYAAIIDGIDPTRIKFVNPYGWEQVGDIISYNNPVTFEHWRQARHEIESVLGTAASDKFMAYVKKKLTITINDILSKSASEIVSSTKINTDKSILTGVIKEGIRECIANNKITIGKKTYDLNDLAGKVIAISEFENKGSRVDEGFHQTIGRKLNKTEQRLALLSNDDLIEIFIQDVLDTAKESKDGNVKHNEISNQFYNSDSNKDKNLYILREALKLKEEHDRSERKKGKRVKT